MSDQSGTGATPSPDSNSTDAGATPSQSSIGTVVIPDTPSQASVTPTEAAPTDAGGTRDADSDADRDETLRDGTLSAADLQKALRASRKEARENAKELARYRDAEQARADADKTELQRATERAERAEARVAEIERESLARQVASEAGIPNLWQRLSGSDIRTLRADAHKLRDELGISQPSMDGGVRAMGVPPQPSSMDDLIRAGARR